jgi:hypothetical protein
MANNSIAVRICFVGVTLHIEYVHRRPARTSLGVRQRTDQSNIDRSNQGKDTKGGYSWLTPAGMVAAGIAHNPDYGKMAAESIAKELEERKLVPPTAQASATIETDQTKPGERNDP